MSDQTRLLAGAARACITPGPEYFPVEHFNNHMTGKPSVFSGKIREDIFFRVVVIQNGGVRLVWAVLDLPGVPDTAEMTQVIADTAGTDLAHVFYTCTHNHSGFYADNPIFAKWYGEPFATKMANYRAFLREVVPETVKKAIEALEPARMGVYRGECYLNVNRNEKELGPKAGTYGYRVGGPTDRDLYLVRFDNEAGQPIALLYNFAVHACMMIHNNPDGNGTEISGDFVGAACRIIEKSYDEKAVVVFTSGAAGDMNPIQMSRVNIVEPDGTITTKELGAAGPIILEFMGNRLARDVVKANEKLVCEDESPALWAGIRRFMLPPGADAIEGSPREVEVEVRLMQLGDLCVLTTNGEIFNQIGRRMKDSTPYKNTFLVTHAGPRIGYIKDDSGEGLYERGAMQAVEELLHELKNSPRA